MPYLCHYGGRQKDCMQQAHFVIFSQTIIVEGDSLKRSIVFPEKVLGPRVADALKSPDYDARSSPKIVRSVCTPDLKYPDHGCIRLVVLPALEIRFLLHPRGFPHKLKFIN